MPKRTKVMTSKCKDAPMVCSSCGGTDHQCMSSKNVLLTEETRMWKQEMLQVDATSSISYPKFIELKNRKSKDYHDRVVEIKASPKNLMEKYFHDMLVDRMVHVSNQYISEQREENPKLYCWKMKDVNTELSYSCIWHFLAIVYYLGLLPFQAKETTDLRKNGCLDT
eukprot:11064613-Ditylum_brightwellii.AAC.1